MGGESQAPIKTMAELLRRVTVMKKKKNLAENTFGGIIDLLKEEINIKGASENIVADESILIKLLDIKINRLAKKQVPMDEMTNKDLGIYKIPKHYLKRIS